MATATTSPFSHTSYFNEDTAPRWSIAGFVRYFLENTNTVPGFDYIVDKYLKCLDDILQSGTGFSEVALQQAQYLKEKHKSDVRIFLFEKLL